MTKKKHSNFHFLISIITFMQASKFLNWLHISEKILNLLNSLVFLKQGVYPTVLHRVLQLKTELVDPNEPKSADLSTLTRELLWHSFAVCNCCYDTKAT